MFCGKVRFMPVSWGYSPDPDKRTSGHDIDQFAKYFAMQGLDFEMRNVSGLWQATAFVVEEHGVHVIVAESLMHETLFDALNACYLTLRGFATDSVQPRPD